MFDGRKGRSDGHLHSICTRGFRDGRSTVCLGMFANYSLGAGFSLDSGASFFYLMRTKFDISGTTSKTVQYVSSFYVCETFEEFKRHQEMC